MTERTPATLAAQWLPRAQFRERHEADVSGEPASIIDALAHLDDRDDALVRYLLTLRELPSRVWGSIGGRSALRGKPRFGMHSFTPLERTDTTLVLGLVGRFWRADFGLETIADAAAFRAFDKLDAARLVMTFEVRPRNDRNACSGRGECDCALITETYVQCANGASLVKFAAYWAAIRMASGLIRRRILRQVQRKLTAQRS